LNYYLYIFNTACIDPKFSLVGVFGHTPRASVSIEMLSDLHFIEQMIDAFSHGKSIELFEGGGLTQSIS
jgi:hypothetical protein